MPHVRTVDTAHTIETLNARIERLEREIEALRKGGKRAAETATPEVEVKSIIARVESALREKPSAFDELVFRLQVSPKNLATVLTEAKTAGKVYNLGTETRPIWTWRVGDDGDTQDLIRTIEALISIRPFETAELVDATGARRNRISGALVKLQMRRPVQNHGTGKLARWFAPPSRR